MLNVRTDLYIVEIALVNQTGDDGLATIPSHLILRMVAMHVLGKNIDVLRFCIPAHETNTGNTIPVIPDKSVKYHGRERLTNISPQILGMTSRTTAGTIGDINRECYLIGNLLKDNTSIDVLQHKAIGMVPLALDFSCLIASMGIESATSLFLTSL